MTTTTLRPTVRAVIRHGERYLIVQHNNQLPENVGKWGTPGGRIEASDIDHAAALRREMWEEFRLTVEIVGFIRTYAYGQRLHHVYLVIPSETRLEVDSNEVLATAWLTAGEIRTMHEAGRMHTGFELDAVQRSLTLFPPG